MFSYGFYNSVNGDRKYDSVDFNRLFEGIITEGVFANIGDKFFLRFGGNGKVIVGTGKAWFYNTWNVLDSEITLDVEPASPGYIRDYTIVLQVDHSTRTNRILAKNAGERLATDGQVQWNWTGNAHMKELLIGWAEVNSNGGMGIFNAVGQSYSPYVTAPLTNVSVEHLFDKWKDEYERYKKASEQEFREWFNTLKNLLSDNTELALLKRLDVLEERVLNDIFELGNRSTTIEKQTNAVEITEDFEGARKVTRITNDGLGKVVTSTLYPATGQFNYESIITIRDDLGKKQIIQNTTKKPK